MPTLRFSGALFVTSSPPIQMTPEVGLSRPASGRRKVLMPQTLGPSMAARLPSGISSEMPFRAGTLTKYFLRLSSLISDTSTNHALDAEESLDRDDQDDGQEDHHRGDGGYRRT